MIYLDVRDLKIEIILRIDSRLLNQKENFVEIIFFNVYISKFFV